MKKFRSALVLAAKGKGNAVLPDSISQPDAVASIRHGLAQARKGQGRPADEVFDELEREDAG